MGVLPWAITAPPKANADGGFTRSESALYARIVFAGQQVGIAQTVRWEGQSGNTPVKGIGEGSSENRPGDLFFTGSLSRFSIRGQRLLDIVIQAYPGLKSRTGLVVDFRTLPFELQILHQQTGYTPGTPNKGANAPPFLYADTSEKLEGVWIQTWGAEYGDPNALRLENLTFWAMGYTYGGADGGVIATVGQTPDPMNWQKLAA